MSRLMWFLIVSTLFTAPIFGSDVDVTVDFSENVAIFSYEFVFDEEESYNSFSFEKPRDAILLYARDSKENFVRTSIAGDYFIVYPRTTSNETFEIQFESTSIYNSIINQNIFSTYFSFNFELSQLSILTDFSELGKEIVSINPRDHTIIDENELLFDFTNVERETFLQVEFLGNSSQETSSTFNDSSYVYVLLSFLILLLIFLAFFLRNYIKILKPKKRSSSDVVLSQNDGETLDGIDVDVLTQRDDGQKELDEEILSTQDDAKESNEKKFEEYLEKYLTENEREVVLIVREHNGVAQNEILHHLPSLTKSNLSKIITKLHGKRVLSRIRVGKINKIYLGDKLTFEVQEE